ncbi:MAG: Flp family type IVb pilin [Acidobacteria bacterium]|nr:Flp family type IVb pilin [Acidobacteriota bacterium]
MRNFYAKLYLTWQHLLDERGQDLIEYALVVALIALAATAGMSDVAANINLAFNNIAKKLNTYTT